MVTFNAYCQRPLCSVLRLPLLPPCKKSDPRQNANGPCVLRDSGGHGFVLLLVDAAALPGASPVSCEFVRVDFSVDGRRHKGRKFTAHTPPPFCLYFWQRVLFSFLPPLEPPCVSPPVQRALPQRLSACSLQLLFRLPSWPSFQPSSP